MKNKNTNYRPGDLFIDYYTPKATEDAREEAHANLRALVALLVRIDERLALEERGTARFCLNPSHAVDLDYWTNCRPI